MKKIVIIGGGIAGLSAGCYARMNGYDTGIFEMHDRPGGLCTSWQRKGYTFDICIHWLVGSSPQSPYYAIWRELGALQGKKIYYRDRTISMFLKEQTIHFYNDPDMLEKELKRIAPQDGPVIDELMDCVRKFYLFCEIPPMKPKELFTIFDTLKMLKTFAPFMSFLKKYGKATIDDFADLFTSPILRKAMKAFRFDSSSNDFFAVPFSLATRDYGFPEGGSGSFAQSIERRFAGLGGTIRYGAKVEKVLVENGKAAGIRLADGTEVPADIVISAADGRATHFGMLEGKYLDKKIRLIYETESVMPSYVQVSIGVNMDLSERFSPSALYFIHELDEPVTISGEERNYLQIEHYSFDPSFAPPGKSTLVIAFFSQAAYWERLRGDREAYRREKKRIETTVVSRLEKIIPGVSEKIETIDVATPLTIVRYTGNWQGSIMGFTKPFTLNIPRTLRGLKDFYMAGQWVGDSGLPGAAGSGRDIVQLICRKDGRKFKTSAP
ncbi:MAG: NAD(P)/FAD-dependent oxidoreductase [Spirochaetales bacterium]|nr:NAD(P)/FAD-dependent oxidoreductase [Spirochaetales bacterium]